MKKIYLMFILIISIALFSASDNAADANTNPAEKAPEFTLKDISGKKVSLSSFKGKPVLLNFWATWCGYCKKERPHLNAVYNAYKDKGLVVISVSTDQSVDRVKSYLKQIPADFLVLTDTDGRAASSYEIRGFPSSFLIDRNGFIKRRFVGYVEWTNPASGQMVEALINEE